MSKRALVFISCGQFAAAERKLGKAIAKMVEDVTGAEGYFAQNQSSLEGLTGEVFGALNRASAFIAVMHRRGEVIGLSGKPEHSRGSVWVEQEIAIAGFLKATRKGNFPVAAYTQAGIKLEGARETLILNPMEFTRHPEIMKDLKKRISKWGLSPQQSVEVEIGYVTTQNSETRHDYKLAVTMTNKSAEVIDDYFATLQFPTPFLSPNLKPEGEMDGRATADHRVFRLAHQKLGGPLEPNEARQIFQGVSYKVTEAMHHGPGFDFALPVKVDVFVKNKLAASRSKPFREIQKF